MLKLFKNTRSTKNVKAESNSFFVWIENEVRKVPIADVIGKYTKLVPRWDVLTGLCPFAEHGYGISREYTYDLIVNPSTNVWFCQTEKIGGSAITFVSKINEISHSDAVLKIAVDHGIISKEECTNLRQSLESTGLGRFVK